MSSTATSILRLEKQANGENDTTWGTKLNNMIDMIESSIAGVVSLSLTNADVTLTNVDYTDDQAKKNVVYCSGALSGICNIIVPNKTKTYRIINNTTNAFAVKVKTASSSAITITQGASCEVWCNGSDVMSFMSPMCVIGTGAPSSLTGAAASSVSVTPSGNLTSTDGQAALVELQLDVDGRQPLDPDLTAIASLTATKGNLIAGDGSNWAALGVGTNGYVHMADSTQATGTKWASIMPATTPILVQQTAAPTGYTKVTTHNDKALRVVSGTASSGGSVAFTTAMASTVPTGTIGGTAISTAQLASHTHPYIDNHTNGTTGSGGGSSICCISASNESKTTSATGSDSTHTHSFTGDAINLAVQYVDLVICTKD